MSEKWYEKVEQFLMLYIVGWPMTLLEKTRNKPIRIFLFLLQFIWGPIGFVIAIVPLFTTMICYMYDAVINEEPPK